MRRYEGILIVVVSVMCLICTIGCSTKAGTGAIIGGATGAVTGAIVAGDDDRIEGAVIGGIAGAAVGGGIGYYLDHQAKKYQTVKDVEVEKVVEPEKEGVKPEPAHLTLRISNEVLFEKDSSSLTAQGTRKIEEIASIMRQDPKSHVIVNAYTSSEGDDEYNMKLSTRRADIIRNQLIAFKVSAPRITSLGMGESNPVADNSTEKGRAQNRRAEIEIFPAEDIK